MTKKQQLLNIFYQTDLRLNRIPMLVAVRKGLTYMIPLLLLGSFALLIISLPIPAYQNFMSDSFGEEWDDIFLFVRDGTFHIMSLLLVISISYSYINELGQKYNISAIIASLVSLSSFIAISGISQNGFYISNLGTTGTFIAIIVSTTSSFLFVRLSKIEILKMRAYTSGANTTFNYALNSIFPASITISIYAAINSILAGYYQITSIHHFLSMLFSSIFTKIESPFFSGILFIFLVHLFWFFGMHGSNVLEPVTQTVFAPGTVVNHVLTQSGHPPEFIFTKAFFDSFVLMGGCGASFCLVIAILLVGKFKNQKGLAKMSFLPLMFNINELIVFGIPIVFNPIFLIPFLGIPILLTIISFLVMHFGIVPLTVHSTEWTTPILLSGYLVTQSISGSLLQLINFVIGVACYIPFVKLSESAVKEQLQRNLLKVYDTYQENEERGYPSTLLSRHDEIGNISRFLASDLENDLRDNKIKLFYQPQVNHDGNVFGVEALLRWRHDTYGYIYPPLVIALAEESNLIDSLGNWIFEQACSDLKKIRQHCNPEILLSINTSTIQLENMYFAQGIRNIIEKNDVPSESIIIEITERIALSGSKRLIDQINSLKALGVKLAMDDFGMGHSSLKYLQEYNFDILKLDGSIVREVANSSNCRNIISSIVYLCSSLNCSIVAEYVEEKAQRDALFDLGCDLYQGYLYSEPLPFQELLEFLN